MPPPPPPKSPALPKRGDSLEHWDSAGAGMLIMPEPEVSLTDTGMVAGVGVGVVGQ